MNKVMIAATLAGSFLLMSSPEAAAHKEVHYRYGPPAYYHSYDRVEVRRVKHMPRWLKRKHGFRHWYRHSPLTRDKRLTWNELFRIYKWERHWGRNYYRSHNYWNDYFNYRYRHHDRRFDDGHRRDRRHRRDR